jgi:hypothetical protein
MQIICKSCASIRDWRKQQHERIADQTCTCGGKYKMFSCDADCKYAQFVKCKESGKCLRRNGNEFNQRGNDKGV